LDKSQGEFTFWDVGGQSVLRKIWNKYFSECNGLVFVIDGADEMRFAEARETVATVFDPEASEVADVPVVFLLNKNDRPDFKGVDYITDKIGLSEVSCAESVILPISAIDTNGLEAAVNWIMSAVADNKK
jgi:ADP-ribosylation factor related protein 1